jgi:hypothetical protein
VNKSLVQNKAEFYTIMRDYGYWDNPGFTDEKADHASWVSRPEFYPCLIVHEWGLDHRGRNVVHYEFIYLNDFELGPCEFCKSLVSQNQLEWLNLGENSGYACKACHDKTKE